MKKQTLKEKKAEMIRRIMDAATEVFAEEGYAGARMDEIAKRAEVNKAMIYYRIGDKEVLYAQILHGILSDAADIVTKEVATGKTPEEKMVCYIRAITSVPEIHPYMPNLMMWELASGGRNFPPIVAAEFVRILELLMGIIKEGSKKGVFSEMNPFMLQMMIVGTMAFYKASTPLRAKFASLTLETGVLESDRTGSASVALEKLVLNAIKK